MYKVLLVLQMGKKTSKSVSLLRSIKSKLNIWMGYEGSDHSSNSSHSKRATEDAQKDAH